MNDEVTVLVSSCDAYEDLWYPFFDLLKKNWDEVKDLRIVLNTETKKYSHNGLSITCPQLFWRKNVKWGERLIKTLQFIETEYVIFLLDDFFIKSKVDNDEIARALHYLKENPQISVFYFTPTMDYEEKESTEYKGYSKLKTDASWKLNTQAALWRRDKLISYIRPHENAWIWERYGSERAIRYTELFYGRNYDEKRIFDYEDDWGGAIHRGKWTPYAIELCQDNYDINFEDRGIETRQPPFEEEKDNRSFIKKLFGKGALVRMKRYVKYKIGRPYDRYIHYKSIKE